MDNATFLSLSATDAIQGLLEEAYASDSEALDILENWTDGVIDPAASTYTLSTNSFNTDSVIGQYIGSVTFPYVKRNLNNLIPYPLVYPLAYPTTFVLLQTYFQEQFNIVLEDGEFAVTGNTVSGALSGTQVINAVPNPSTGFLTVVAQATSGRFVEGSSFTVLPNGAGIQVPLSILLALTTPPNLDILTDH
jgi:hypothetical protein